jgi:subtilisin family serine protease
MKTFSFLLFLTASNTFAQAILSESETKLLNWQNKDLATDSVVGMSTEKAYNELLSKKPSKKVIVAIIDSGVDTDHEDIKDNVWVNEDEIPGNGIDDDKNGYVDDVHGWSFLGNPKGENINHETLEMTRIYKKYSSQFDKVKKEQVSKSDREAFDMYQKAKAEYVEKLAEAKSESSSLGDFIKKYNQNDSILRNYLKTDTFSVEQMRAIQTDDAEVMNAAKMLSFLKESGVNKDEIEKYLGHIDDKLKYYLNVNYNPRTIIGDDPEKWDGKAYGSNNAKGPDPGHGTHVAGIVAAIRKNGKGIDGVAINVRIMSVRAVPDGDERDKDIAMAIRYAVDNGAEVINMSFGKGFSPQKQWVDDAVRYADQKGVILVHAAGNDAQNTDVVPSYPSKFYQGSNEYAKDWLSIGASTMQKGNTLPAFFSNYGKKTVDVFAPGHEIYSLKPGNKYETNSGTSMAAPMVTGVAALLKSYYPELSAKEIIEIIIHSGTDLRKEKITFPGGKKKLALSKKIKFKKLSKSGRVVNVYQAVLLAEKKTSKQ